MAIRFGAQLVPDFRMVSPLCRGNLPFRSKSIASLFASSLRSVSTGSRYSTLGFLRGTGTTLKPGSVAIL